MRGTSWVSQGSGSSFVENLLDRSPRLTCARSFARSSVLVSRTNVIFSVDSDEEHLDRIHQLDKLFPLAKRLKVVAHPSRPLDSVRFSLSRPLVLPPRLDALELHKLQIDSKALSNLLQTSQLRMFKCCHVEFIDLGRWKHGSTGVTSLYLRDCSFVSVRGLGRQAERRKALGALLKVFQGVQELTLESMELSDGLLGGYLAGLDELTSLNLAGSRGFSHRAISRVQKNKLKELVLSACWVLNDDMCRVICEVCPGTCRTRTRAPPLDPPIDIFPLSLTRSSCSLVDKDWRRSVCMRGRSRRQP